MIKYIFLDAGGVILDEALHERIKAEIISGLISQQNHDYNIRDYWNDAGEAVFKFVPSVYNYIIRKNASSIEEYQKNTSLFHSRWDELKPPLILMEGIQHVLAALSEKYKLGILGQYGNSLLALLREKNLLHYFAFQNTQDDFTLTKPDPRYFEQVLNKAGVECAESAMVGDRIDKDIIPAKQVGMKTIRIKCGLHRNQMPRVPEEIPDYEFDSIKNLIDLKL